MKKRSRWILFIVFGFFWAWAITCNAEPWKEEFDRLCGHAEEGESLPTDELKKILAECDVLLGKLQELDSPEKKVYLFRLKKCRNFYQYIHDLRER